MIQNGILWLEALEKRNLASHTYDDKILEELEELIIHTYYPILDDLKEILKKKL